MNVVSFLLLTIRACFFCQRTSNPESLKPPNFEHHHLSKKAIRYFSGLLYLLLATGCISSSWAEEASNSIQKPAVASKLASRVLLTDSAKIGARYIGLGLYGNIVYSDDKGDTWQQAKSPTQTLLTNIFFIDDREGWAGGHDTLILHTIDAGETWEIQHEDPIPGGDIPKPILDIVFIDKNIGYAAGAYGLLLQTDNGGTSWINVSTDDLYDRLDSLDMEPEPNFNSIFPLGDKLFIPAEVGTLLLFDPTAADGDEQRWEIWDSPYTGSYFGGKQLSSGALLIYGLRGNVYTAEEPWKAWQKIETNVITNIYDSIEVGNGNIILLGSSGTILNLSIDDNKITRLPYKKFDTLVSGEILNDRELLLFGTRGTQKYELN